MVYCRLSLIPFLFLLLTTTNCIPHFRFPNFPSDEFLLYAPLQSIPSAAIFNLQHLQIPIRRKNFISPRTFSESETADTIEVKLFEPRLYGIRNLRVHVSSSPPLLKLRLVEVCNQWLCSPVHLSHAIPISSQIDGSAGVTVHVSYDSSSQLYVHLILKKEITRVRRQVSQCMNTDHEHDCLLKVCKTECRAWGKAQLSIPPTCTGNCVVEKIMKCKNTVNSKIRKFLNNLMLVSFTVMITLMFVFSTAALVLIVLVFPAEELSIGAVLGRWLTSWQTWLDKFSTRSSR